MSFSEFGQYIRASWTSVVDSDQPVDAGLARALVNNAQHVYDERGQVLVNLVDRGAVPNNITVSVGAYQSLMVFGPYPIRLRPTSGAYRIRLRVGIARSTSGVADFRFVVSPTYAGLFARAASGSPSSSVYDVSVNTTTVTYSSPASDSMIWISDEEVASAYQPITSMNEAGDETAATWPQCYIGAFARKASGSPLAVRLAQLYACEYMGL